MTRGDFAVAAALALAVFAVHAVCPVKTPFDSRWSIPIAASIAFRGDSNIDEWSEQVQADDYGVDRAGGHLFGSFPLGVSYLALPFIAATDVFVCWTAPLATRVPKLSRLWNEWAAGIRRTGALDFGFDATVEMVIASALVGLAAAVIFLLGAMRLPRGSAVALALVFAFCTSAWSIGSRALWQHGPSMLMLACALYALRRAEKQPYWAALSALPIAFSFVVRPTNAVSVVLFTLYVAARYRRWLPHYLGLAALVAVPFVAQSLANYGTALPPYYLPSRLGSGDSHFFLALVSNWLSPSRGLLVYSPVFALSLVGMWLRLRERPIDWLEVALVVAVVLHTIAVSSFAHWWAGHSYGPRFMSDLVPYLVYFLIPVFERARSSKSFKAALAATCLFSFAIHLRGATSWAPYAWDDVPENVDAAPLRIWSWSDPQWLRR